MNILLRILGPEFQRNTLMRFSLFSVLLIPILIGVVLCISYMSYLVHYDARMAIRVVQGTQELFHSDPHWSLRSLFVLLPFLFLILYLLGTYEAASAFTSEIRNKTWDMKKVSAITPLHLVVGKLFGVTSYVWYVSTLLLCACLYAYAYYFDVVSLRESELLGTGVKDYPEFRDILLMACVVILPAFFAHIIALYGSLLNLQRGKMGSILIVFAALFLATYLHTLLSNLFQIKYYSDETDFLYNNMSDIVWFGMTFSPASFSLGTVGYVITFVCLGIYRLVRTELNFKSFPFVYLGFLISICLYFSGFSSHYSSVAMRNNVMDGGSLIMGFYLSAFIVFVMASARSILSSADNIGLYQRFFISLCLKNFKRALENIPVWMITLPVCLVVLCLWSISVEELELGALFFGLSLVLFMIRDGIVQHLLMLGNKTGRGGVKLAVYYLFAYFILPLLVGYAVQIFGSKQITWSNLANDHHWVHYVLGTFYPNSVERPDAALLPVFIQILGLSVLLWRKVRVSYITEA